MWEIRGRLKAHSLTQKYNSDMLQPWYTETYRQTHICTFLVHSALKPQHEHSFTVLMRQRIKRQTEGPLCSPSPPQRAPSPGAETRHGGGWMEGGQRCEKTDKCSVKQSMRRFCFVCWDFQTEFDAVSWRHCVVLHTHTFSYWFMLIRRYWSVSHHHY